MVPILYIIDTRTRYSAATALENEELELCQQAINKFAEPWISNFGCPKNIISGNVVMSSREFNFMATSAWINVYSTDSEANWSNNICEQQNRVLEDMINKIKSEVASSYNMGNQFP